MAKTQADKLNHRLKEFSEVFGNLLVDGFHYLALFAIGGATAWSAVIAFMEMVNTGHATIADILLLFIFLELGAMVGIYFKTNRLPVQFLLYVAITVMTCSLASSLNIMDMTDQHLLAITGAILMLAISVLVLRYASYKFPPFVSRAEPEDTR